MKQPELKLGRKVIAWNSAPYEYKGIFISNSSKGVWVLMAGTNTPRCFDNVKPDLTAEPMTGDEVEVQPAEGHHWISKPLRRYIGINIDGNPVVDSGTGNPVIVDAVRFPQQSKRDRVRELIESNLFSVDTMIDQIDYIYKEES